MEPAARWSYAVAGNEERWCKPASVQELLTNGILKGKDKPVGIHG